MSQRDQQKVRDPVLDPLPAAKASRLLEVAQPAKVDRVAQQDRVVENQPRGGPVRVDQARAGAVEKDLREGRSFSKRQGLRSIGFLI